MKGTFGLLALAGAALASPMPQAVTSMIAPSAPAPSGCTPSYSGTFEITVVNVTQSKRGLDARQQDGALMCTLSGGVLKDQAGRTGYIAANNQFQFDNPIQAGAIYTSGWSVCANNTLALGGSAVFYQCLSGSFYNLYDKSQGGQCAAIYIEVMGMSGASSGAPAPAPTMAPSASVSQISDGQPQATTGKPAVSQISDGQPQATTGKPMMVSQISDGQPQAPTGMPVSQISDGQPQAPKSSAAAVSQISDGQPQAPTAMPSPAVSQISDGQPQAPTASPVSQISDGQPQAPTAMPSAPAPAPAVSQISDGQPQAPTASPVSQISDGQPQAPTAMPSPAVSQISDGQPQAPTGTPVSQISDGQPQAPTATKQPVSQISDGQPQATTGVAPATFTGAAAPRQIGGSFAFVAGLVGAVALL